MACKPLFQASSFGLFIPVPGPWLETLLEKYGPDKSWLFWQIQASRIYHEGRQERIIPAFLAGKLASARSFTFLWVDVSHHPLHLSHLILLHEVVQYRRFTPFLKQTLWWQTMGGWFNLNEVLIRRERGNNTWSSLNICLVLLATPCILSHVGA